MMDGRPLFDELPAPDRLRFVFGHFVNESLIAFFADREFMLFTGLRSPAERAASHLAQMNTVRHHGKLPLVSAEEYLNQHSNSMCDEVLRGFPTFEQKLSGQSKFEKARAVLSLFDYIYDSDQFLNHVHHILGWIDLASARIISDNVTKDKLLDSELMAFNAEQAEKLKIVAADALVDDFQLFEFFKPHYGIPKLRERFASEPWRIEREDVLAIYGDKDQARREFAAWETRHHVYEFYLLGQLPFLQASLERRIARAQDLLKIVGGHKKN
jgi:hypothetical protein